MTDISSEDHTLAAELHQLSSRLTDAQAAIACGVGIAGAATIGLAVPAWWRLALVFLALACFGAWIVLDRSDDAGFWRVAAQRMSAAVGTACIFLLGLSLLMLALGTWIS